MAKDIFEHVIKLKEYADYGEPGLAVEKKIRETLLGLRPEKVTPAVLPINGPYKTEIDENNNLRGITSAHFDVMPKQIEKHLEFQTDPFIWLQLLLKQKGTVMETSRGPMEISGFIMSFLTPDNKVLLIGDNEPGMPAKTNAQGEEIHPVLRNPVQTGMPKYNDILHGTTIKDPILKAIVDTGILTLERMNSPWTISNHDPTRMEGQNIVKMEQLTEEEVEKLSKVLPVLAVTVQELAILVGVGDYLAPHTTHNALIEKLLELPQEI